MIDDLKPYPVCKESGLPWLGKVPRSWSIQRIKTILRQNDSRSVDGIGTLLALTRQRGLIPRRDMTEKMHSAKTLVGYKKYRSGQILMNRMQAWSGMFGAGLVEGLVSPDYAVFDIISGHDVKIVLERLKSPDMVQQFALESKGIGSGFNRLYTDRFGAISTSLPPPDEQAAIVRFLDHANGKIERAIRAKKKLIALLNEQKQGIIHRTVTRGLDPIVKLKPSGIPWLGDVPEQWSMRRNGYLFDERIERGRPGLPILVVSLRTGVTEGSTHDEDGREKRLIADVTKYKFADKGDIAYNMMRMWQGAVGVVPIAGLVSPAYVVAKPRPEVLSAYYDHLFHTEDCKNEVNRHSRGIVTDRNRLYWDQFKKLFVPLPPFTEQQQIVAWIDRETATLNAAICSTEREISLLREYRTTLTADVVTGKLDVREAVQHLPAEAEQPPPADDMPDGDIETEAT